MTAPIRIDDVVLARAPAKINLHLGVGDRRPDGYHDLVSVFCAVSLYDEVVAAESDGLSLTVEGEGAELLPTDEGNLAWAAAAALARAAGIEPDVALTLRKSIPVAAGLAGGSADAAATLIACDALWQSGMERAELIELAAGLGSDVAFSLTGGLALGTGRGELLSPVLAAGTWHWVLAVAAEGLSTAQVYAELDRLRGKHSAPVTLTTPDELLNALRAKDLDRIAAQLHNDLEPPAFGLRPELRRTKRTGTEEGAAGALLCGSGPTVAFLVAGRDEAVSLAARLAGAGVCRTVRTASGPVVGARITG